MEAEARGGMAAERSPNGGGGASAQTVEQRHVPGGVHDDPVGTPPRGLAIDAELLNEVFRFKYKAPSTSQEEHVCDHLAQHFCGFVDSVESVHVEGFVLPGKDPLIDDRLVPLHQVAEQEHDALKRACTILTRKHRSDQQRECGDVWIEKWFPKYGCALQMELVSVSTIVLKLVYLDGWEHVKHFPPESECIHSSVSTQVSVFHCGAVAPQLKDKLLGTLAKEIDQAKPRTGTERSAAFNDIGHQKTPQFIGALIRIAQASLAGFSKPSGQRLIKGGTTDVGLHTGGRSRDTCWPLVQGVVRLNLPGNGVLFEKTMLLFKLAVLSGRVKALHNLAESSTLTGGTDFWEAAEDAFSMLQSIVLLAVDLVQRDYDVSVLEERLTALRQDIFDSVKRVHDRTIAFYTLPSSEVFDELKQTTKYPMLMAILSHVDVYNLRSELKYDVREHARKQLQFYNFLNPANTSCSSILKWLATVEPIAGNKFMTIVVLRTIEGFMFSKSATLEGSNGNEIRKSPPSEYSQILQAYEKWLVEWEKEPLSNSLFQVEQRSHVLLVKWITFCLAHHAFEKKHLLLKKCGIALSWRDLDVAVLRDKAAIDALTRVAGYIRTWNARRHAPLFDLRDHAPTAHFARTYAATSQLYLTRYEDEVKRVKQRIAFHWDLVRQKKSAALALQTELKQIDTSLQHLQQLLHDEQVRLSEANRFLGYSQQQWQSPAILQYSNDITHLSNWRYTRQRALEETLMVPSFIVNPLPRDQMFALEALFFLDVPADIALLGELCMIAQRALAPRKLSKQNVRILNEEIPKATWLGHYSSYSSIQYPSDATLVAYSPSLMIPQAFGPWSVEELQSQEDYASRCVWYPPGGDTQTYWKSSPGSSVNPFKITREMTISFFTPQMPSEHSNLQWAVAFPGGEQRGNLVYAGLNESYPEEFDKTSFIAFGSLRAFPNQQIRKLCCALKENLLPWSHPSVGVVVRQAMYHVGALTDEHAPVSLWKSDIRDDSGLAVLCAAIDQVARKLTFTPRNYEDVPLLSELAGFVSQLSVYAKPLVSKFVTMSRKWAGNVRKQYHSNRNISSFELTELRAKECLLYGYALQGYALGSLDATAAYEMGELIVLFRNAMLFSTGSTLWPTLQKLEIVVAEIMTRRAPVLVMLLAKKEHAMTSLLRLVNASVSPTLKWECAPPDKLKGGFVTYFDAFDNSSGIHYAINLFTGMVLTEGSSSGGLPAHIRDHIRYKQLFGDHDFEVAFSKGVYRTAFVVDECYLDFSVVEDELHIREVYYDAVMKIVKVLELCSLKWLESLGDILPARIVWMQSLWYCAEQDCILVRPSSAFERKVDFVITFGKSQETPVTKCFQVVNGDKRLPHPELLMRVAQYHAIVTIDEQLHHVLRKFEDAAYIHTLRTPSGSLKVHFPRFRLTFVLDDDNDLVSSEYEGYILDPQQQFHDAFPQFHRYFVLRLRDASDIMKPKLRLLVPFGKIVRHNGSRTIDIEIPDDPAAELDVAVFDVHRRLGTLSTESILSRLQLCALLASTGTVIPSTYFEMTGSEAALQILHGCYSSSPFSPLEKELLWNVCSFGHRAPGLKILASSILRKSERCSFLTTATTRETPEIDCSDELDEYSAMCATVPQQNPLRTRLRDTEGDLLLANVFQRETGITRISAREVMELLPSPVKDTYVSDMEAMFSLFLSTLSTSSVAPPLPLKLLESDGMGKEMNTELHETWKAYHDHPEKQLTKSPSSFVPTWQALLKDATRKRREVEQYLYGSVDATQRDGTSRLLSLVNYLPIPTISDIMRSSFDDDILLQLAPRLSTRSRSVFRVATLQYMELCVLEDKLERLVVNGQRSVAPSYFVDELNTVRRWKIKEHPYWLAFEMESRFQIRHEQYVVAKHLIEKPGSVCQMNMGRGKTKVVLPMLFLHFSHQCRDRVVRAHFLTPLLSETRQFMHRFLSASSILDLKFVEQSFHRNIDLDLERLSLMREELAEAKACGKFLIVSPEHRMSLELKLLDLRTSSHDERQDMIDILEEILDQKQYIDILDESDAVLHHKYHLIYAVGVPQKLECGESRWVAAEALLRVVVAGGSESLLEQVLQRPHVSFFSAEYSERLGGYNGLRLNALGDGEKDELRVEFRRALVFELMRDPPFPLLWLKAFASHGENTRDRLAEALTDPTTNLDHALETVDPTINRYREQLLSLRGLIAFGILEHCLEKRHRVEYGLPEHGARQKRMAIPFRAADIPSERSEFSHPEVGITLTLLGYYHSGLSESELKEALRQLLLLGASEQDQFYSKWYAAVTKTNNIRAEDLVELPRDASQLSPKDSRQFALIYGVYRYTMEVINFFVNTCVFPTDTTQYPHRVTRSAWNLAGGDWNAGFSGTNDNHRLLPLSMTQRELDEPSLRGTNGRMIDLILNVFHGYEVIDTNASSVIPWQSLLQMAVAKQAHALIDAGALLAGVLNNEAASYLLEMETFPFAGVTYYDTREKFDCWVVLNATNKLATPLKHSTILEEDTFVIFDDARSRGSDMRLDPEAVAVVTLGPKLTKDKLMQGAGRMRQLGCNQTLWFVSLVDVAQSILQVCGKRGVNTVVAVDILDWVMDNTKSEAVLGLLEWAHSGLHFSKTKQDLEAEILEENWSLEALYASGHREELIRDIVGSKVRELYGDDDAVLDELVKTVRERGCKYGLDEKVLVTAHDEECERELHHEQFEEREDETTRADVKASTEVVWDYDNVLSAGSARSLEGVVETMKLGDFVRGNLLPKTLSEIHWNTTQVFGTANFFSTVVSSSGAPLHEFVRLIDAMLLFPDGTKLLLSEYEADEILQRVWKAKEGVSFTFLNLSFAVDAVESAGELVSISDILLRLGNNKQSTKKSSDDKLDPSLTTHCQLYNGETKFANSKSAVIESSLRRLLQPMKKREAVFHEFAVARGNGLRWRYSFLHQLCHEMDLNDFVVPNARAQSPALPRRLRAQKMLR